MKKNENRLIELQIKGLDAKQKFFIFTPTCPQNAEENPGLIIYGTYENYEDVQTALQNLKVKDIPNMPYYVGDIGCWMEIPLNGQFIMAEQYTTSDSRYKAFVQKMIQQDLSEKKQISQEYGKKITDKLADKPVQILTQGSSLYQEYIDKLLEDPLDKETVEFLEKQKDEDKFEFSKMLDNDKQVENLEKFYEENKGQVEQNNVQYNAELKKVIDSYISEINRLRGLLKDRNSETVLLQQKQKISEIEKTDFENKFKILKKQFDINLQTSYKYGLLFENIKELVNVEPIITKIKHLDDIKSSFSNEQSSKLKDLQLKAFEVNQQIQLLQREKEELCDKSDFNSLYNVIADNQDGEIEDTRCEEEFKNQKIMSQRNTGLTTQIDKLQKLYNEISELIMATKTQQQHEQIQNKLKIEEYVTVYNQFIEAIQIQIKEYCGGEMDTYKLMVVEMYKQLYKAILN